MASIGPMDDASQAMALSARQQIAVIGHFR
jgi:hypothetical protein